MSSAIRLNDSESRRMQNRVLYYLLLKLQHGIFGLFLDSYSTSELGKHALYDVHQIYKHGNWKWFSC